MQNGTTPHRHCQRFIINLSTKSFHTLFIESPASSSNGWMWLNFIFFSFLSFPTRRFLFWWHTESKCQTQASSVFYFQTKGMIQWCHDISACSVLCWSWNFKNLWNWLSGSVRGIRFTKVQNKFGIVCPINLEIILMCFFLWKNLIVPVLCRKNT